MSKLIDPGVGDILDRLTILSLKLHFGLAAGAEVAHFQREQTALLAKIRARDHSGPWFALLLELATINGLLWHAEDELRAHRVGSGGQPPPECWEMIGRIGWRIQTLNDTRATLIAAINKEAGEAAGSEKL